MNKRKKWVGGRLDKRKDERMNGLEEGWIEERMN